MSSFSHTVVIPDVHLRNINEILSLHWKSTKSNGVFTPNTNVFIRPSRLQTKSMQRCEERRICAGQREWLEMHTAFATDVRYFNSSRNFLVNYTFKKVRLDGSSFCASNRNHCYMLLWNIIYCRTENYYSTLLNVIKMQSFLTCWYHEYTCVVHFGFYLLF